MRTLVDTCVLSELRSKRPHKRVTEVFRSLAEEEIYLSVITLGELRKGIDKLRASARKRSLDAWFSQLVASASDRILPIDLETTEVWGEVNARCEKQGRPIPAIDGLIAATALRHGLRLMTRNTDDFQPSGVPLIDPWKA